MSCNTTSPEDGERWVFRLRPKVAEATQGVFLCLYPPHHHLHSLQHFCKEGWMAVGYQREGLHMAIIQLYLRTGETLQSPLNAEILSNLFAFLELLKAPFIIGGDWQNPPSELAAMVIQSKFKAHLLAGEASTTLQGSEIDYFLVSNSLHGSLTLDISWEVPWKPHCAIHLKYHSEYLTIPVQQIRAFPPIGKALNPHHSWSEFQEPNGPFYFGSRPTPCARFCPYQRRCKASTQSSAESTAKK